jgi:HK97 family phage major capsid protein
MGANANTPKVKPKTTKAMLQARIDQVKSTAVKLRERADKLEREPATVTKTPASVFAAPHVTTGPLGERHYSLMRAIALHMGYVGAEQAKEEKQISEKLLASYEALGFQPTSGPGAFFVPFASTLLPTNNTANEKLQEEIRQKMQLDMRGMDPAALWEAGRKAGIETKALGTVIDTLGGTFVGSPQFMELIDLQRNLEIFARAGASEIGLAPNGRMEWPKLTGASTAYFKGEGKALTESDLKTGDLLFEAKTLTVLTRLNNQLIKFGNIAAEAVVRGDMARVAALRADLSMLLGTGGTEIRGLMTYPTQDHWVTGIDKVIKYVPTGSGAGPMTFNPEDFDRMPGGLPDEVETDELTWVMRRKMWYLQSSKRSDAVLPGDAQGPFVVRRMVQDEAGRRADTVNGQRVIVSSQIPNTRSRGGTVGSDSGTQITLIMAGRFRDWMIARSGIMELLSNQYADGVFLNNQTYLRAIQYLDAGPRYAASFITCDGVLYQ